MNWGRFRWRYWIDLFRGRQLEQDLDEEIRAHIALEMQQRIDKGESTDEARTAALREVRSITLVKEATRDAWAWRTVERIMQDFRYACDTRARTHIAGRRFCRVHDFPAVYEFWRHERFFHRGTSGIAADNGVQTGGEF